MPLEASRPVSLSCLGGWQLRQALLRGICKGAAGLMQCRPVLLSSRLCCSHSGFPWAIKCFGDAFIFAESVACQTGPAGVSRYTAASLQLGGWWHWHV